jgi:hypothetical protein
MRRYALIGLVLGALSVAITGWAVAQQQQQQQQQQASQPGVGSTPPAGARVQVTWETNYFASDQLTTIGGTLLQVNNEWLVVRRSDATNLKGDFWVPRQKVVVLTVFEQ